MVKIWFFLFALQGFASLNPDQALKRLIEGNVRYVEDTSIHPNRGKEQREALYLKQKPFAVIVGCSDSRAAPEIVFDQGVGDLFVVRVAGNVIGPIELDSIEYSALYLGSSVVLVMGHENCGAVEAVLQGNTKDIESVAYLIEPAAREAKRGGDQNLLYRATIDNAVRMQEYLLKTKVIQKLVKEGKLKVHAAYYNFLSGKVELIDERSDRR